jgi:hypothetical protein
LPPCGSKPLPNIGKADLGAYDAVTKPPWKARADERAFVVRCREETSLVCRNEAVNRRMSEVDDDMVCTSKFKRKN